MARRVGILMLCIAFVLALLATTNQASSAGVTAASQLQQSNRQTSGTTQGSLHPQECQPRCTTRCSATAFKKPCMFFCQKCCAKCLCVPAGTYGNKQSCPCYNNWKTKRGSPKCP
ncbi:protein GAST1-like [Malania oleifera]|uniref:protein GAST1-like n=1 Tax=Malania oleifera TaxID=397392 RepID=UPI0025AEC799|nr:protein GAST1-like [Malania oleifera]